MAFTAIDRLRRRIGETIPAGGSESDTMFTNAQLQDILDAVDGDLDKAALAGWEEKAAEYANLVTVAEGNSSRQMSDLHKNALTMVKHYRDVAGTVVTSQRVVIGKIQRRRY